MHEGDSWIRRIFGGTSGSAEYGDVSVSWSRVGAELSVGDYLRIRWGIDPIWLAVAAGLLLVLLLRR